MFFLSSTVCFVHTRRYKEINSRTFSEVHQFVKKLNIMPVLDRHTELASMIQEKSAMDENFLKRLRCEQDLLDGRGIDAACEYVFARPLPLPLSYSVNEIRRPGKTQKKRPNDGKTFATDTCFRSPTGVCLCVC